MWRHFCESKDFCEVFQRLVGHCYFPVMTTSQLLFPQSTKNVVTLTGHWIQMPMALYVWSWEYGCGKYLVYVCSDVLICCARIKVFTGATEWNRWLLSIKWSWHEVETHSPSLGWWKGRVLSTGIRPRFSSCLSFSSCHLGRRVSLCGSQLLRSWTGDDRDFTGRFWELSELFPWFFTRSVGI